VDVAGSAVPLSDLLETLSKEANMKRPRQQASATLSVLVGALSNTIGR
jgi:hypothetical protein